MMPSARFPDLEGASVLITGGGSGIGAALTEGLRGKAARSPSSTLPKPEHGALRPYREGPGPAAAVPAADLRDVEALRAAVGRAAEAHGASDGAHQQRGARHRHAIEDVTVEFWDDNQVVNLRPHFFTAQAVAPGMKAAGEGSIINFTSTSFLINHPDMPSYTAAKAGIIGLDQGAGRQLGKDKIRVNAVAPGWVITERQRELWVTEEALAAHVAKQCIKEVMQPDDLVGTCLFLASDASRMLTAQTLIIDGGYLVSQSRARFCSRRLGHFELPHLASRRGGRGACRAAQRRRHDGDGREVRLRRNPGSASASHGRAGRPAGYHLRHGGRAAGLDRGTLCRRAGDADGCLAQAVAVPGSTATSASCRASHSATPHAPDVMRGEETQLAGIGHCLPTAAMSSACPAPTANGSRSIDGAVAGSRTWMTGELFSVLSQQSILRHALGESRRLRSARRSRIPMRWLAQALGRAGDVAVAAFPIRAATLLHELTADEAAAALVRLADRPRRSLRRARASAGAARLILVASGALGALYAQASNAPAMQSIRRRRRRRQCAPAFSQRPRTLARSDKEHRHEPRSLA